MKTFFLKKSILTGISSGIGIKTQQQDSFFSVSYKKEIFWKYSFPSFWVIKQCGVKYTEVSQLICLTFLTKFVKKF